MRYLLNFSYDGSSFSGYQRQKDNRLKTIQGEIEKCLEESFNKKINIHATSRTDVNVHAINQYAHLDLDIKIAPDKLKKVLNKRLDKHIYIKDVKVVDDNFHARYNVKSKIYYYLINCGNYNPLEVDYVYQYNKKLDIKKMEIALKKILGEHDFRNFTTNQKEKEKCVRNLINVKITEENDIIKIELTGNGFLKHMVRNIVGSLIDVGTTKKDIDYLENILLGKEKRLSKSVPGNGLYLEKVEY